MMRRHPDFLLKHPDLLATLVLPERRWKDAQVVDLQHAMLERLRGEMARLERVKGELLATTRSNLQTQMRIHAAVLMMLGAQSLEDLVETVGTDLVVLLDVDVVAIAIEDDGAVTTMEGIRTLPDGLLDELLGPNNRVLLRDRIAGEERIYAGGAELVRSEALVRMDLVNESMRGLIAFGSRAPDHFHAGQGTELIAFLGTVLGHCISAWIERSE